MFYFSALDSRVASVIGHNSASGNKYGISHDKLSYLKYDTELKQWISIPSGDYSPASDTMIKLEANTAGGDPVSGKFKSVGTDQWGGKTVYLYSFLINRTLLFTSVWFLSTVIMTFIYYFYLYFFYGWVTF